MVLEAAALSSSAKAATERKPLSPPWFHSAAQPGPAEHACDACGYLVIEFRPLDRCPMCGTVAAELVPDVVVVTASAA